jgi:hypothetical protein
MPNQKVNHPLRLPTLSDLVAMGYFENPKERTLEMRRYGLLIYLWGLAFLFGCAAALTDHERCEASETCRVMESEGSVDFQCVEDHRWEDLQDAANFNCVACEEDYEWATEKIDDLSCTPICKYPEDFNKGGLVLDGIATPFAWPDAYFADGSQGQFSFEEFYCDKDNDKIALIIIVSTGWCGSCPEYMMAFGEIAGILDASGAQILYWIMETNTHDEVAESAFADSYVTDYAGVDTFSIRVGATSNQWLYDNGEVVEEKPGSAFHTFVPYVPFGYVIKKDTMKVVNDGSVSYPQYQDFLDIFNRLKAGEYDDPE